MQLMKKQGGTTLVEVLVAIALSSIALLALVVAHATALRYTKMSQYRATAALLATDIGERMRANRGQPAVTDGDGNGNDDETTASDATGFYAGAYDYAQSFESQQGATDAPADQCNLAASACTAAQIAAVDLAQWRRLVRSELPEGAVYLLRRPAEAAMDVWVAWRDPATKNADEAPALATECPQGLVNRNDGGDDASVRCSYFRINL